MTNIDTSSWHTFKISELFEIKKVYGKPISEYTPGNIPYVTGTESNNGVVGYVSAPPEAISKGGCIAVDPITGAARWQSVDFVGRGFSGASINLLYNENLTEKTALYVCTAIESAAKPVAAYTSLFNSKRLAAAEILLPTKQTTEPDWDYMRDRIAELEADRIAVVERYLIETGLNDYELTDADRLVLNSSGFQCEGQETFAIFPKETRTFRVGDLFVQLRGKEAAPNRVPPGNTNMINETSTNNGVTKKASSQYTFSAPAITVSVNFAETVFVQMEDFCASVNILILKNKEIEEFPDAALYIATLLRKNNKQYDYSHKISKDKLNDTMLLLPIQTSSTGTPLIDPTHQFHPDGYIPDWDYMAKYIRAIEKIVIKNVVQYKDEVIAQTKAVVAG